MVLKQGSPLTLQLNHPLIAIFSEEICDFFQNMQNRICVPNC